MIEKQSQETGDNDALKLWTQAVQEMWGGMLRLWTPDSHIAPNAGANEKAGTDESTADRVRASVKASLENWQTLSGAMSEPDSMEALFKGVGAMPEVLAQFAQTSLRGFLEMQSRILDRADRMGEHVDAYTFAHIDEHFFRTWTDMYEKEFSRYLQMPKLGLVREYQERISQAIDAYNRYQVTLSEFLRLLSAPVGRSFTVLQEQVTDLAEKGELPEDGRAYYDMWIKVLEGHYMTLFQTPEYTDILGKTLSSLTSFQHARNAVIEDMIGGLPIPTRSEIDALYEEIHHLKRRLRKLEKK